MRDNLGGAIVRLTIFVVVCAVGLFAMLAIFAQFRFQKEIVYDAEFTNVSGLKNGDFVRIAGVEVGKVKGISIRPDTIVAVEFSTDPSVVLTKGTKAIVRWDNLIGDRYLELQEGAGEPQRLAAGATIPTDRTAPALDLDALIGGFRPLFRALDPEQVNALTGQLIQAFQGQGATINSFLAQTATFTSTLADRDELIRQVIDNLNTVIGSLAGQSAQFGKAVDSLSQLVEGLAARKTDIANGLANANAAAAGISELLAEARPPFHNTLVQSDRATSIVVADHEYVEHLLDGLPDKYQALARQGLYGDFFSFYVCDIVLKVNGKGGQPVYVKVVGQSSGRCTPK
ncbi:MCE family protein [Mycobacterium sp.]|uniref:MCE family protein n=1 Tax=Mycobacterium sp. TaxID=1785 RepID=UPI002DA7C2D8|nr:MCE family protein [Mycobacterium sp.]